ncbi:hypothetical protein GW17_00022996 [Ensete ventricosum]|nr:hypothetical protein GW17_00022996 [Ensete ventricosum]
MPKGSHPYSQRCRPYWWQGWPWAAAHCGRHATSGCARGWLPPLRPTITPASSADLPYGLVLVAVGRPLVGGLGCGLAVGGRPCMRAGRGWPPLLHAAFVAKM